MQVFRHVYARVTNICHHRYLTACSSAVSANYIEIMRNTKEAIEEGKIANANELANFVVTLIIEEENRNGEGDEAVADA